MATTVKTIPSKYKMMGSGANKHIVVESGYSIKNGKKVPAWRIIGRIWGRG